jgi:hypothetical protein
MNSDVSDVLIENNEKLSPSPRIYNSSACDDMFALSIWDNYDIHTASVNKV